jgi:hypothetical protein
MAVMTCHTVYRVGWAALPESAIDIDASISATGPLIAPWQVCRAMQSRI